MDYNEYRVLLRLKDFLKEENTRLLESRALNSTKHRYTHEHMVFMQGFQSAIICIDKFIKKEGDK